MSKVSVLFAGQEIILEYGFASSIQKDFNRADDGTILTEKHSLNLKGSFTATGNTAETRYLNLLQKSVDYADFKGGKLIDRLVSLQGGPLNVVKMKLNGSVYEQDGDPIITYPYAELMSVNISEPPDDTAGIHFQEITLTFESITPPTDSIAVKYKLKSAAESFEIKKEEDKMSYFIMTISNDDYVRNVEKDPYYSYSITHTLSAQGLTVIYDKSNPFPFATNVTTKEFLNTGSPTNPQSVNNQKYEAFYQAYKYVNEKKKDSLVDVAISTDIHGRPFVGSNIFNPLAWVVTSTSGAAVSESTFRTTDFKKQNSGAGTEYFAPEYPQVTGEVQASGALISKTLWNAASGSVHATGLYGKGRYGEYNIVRSSNVDIVGGQYSMTTSYFYSRNPATIEINGVFEKGEDGDDTIRVEGTIQGLDSMGVDSDRTNKFKNAQILFKRIIYDGSIKTGSTPTSYYTKTNQINNPKLYDTVLPIYPQPTGSPYLSGIAGLDLNYAVGTGNITGMNMTGILKDSGIYSTESTWFTDKVIKPWAYGTMIYAFANDVFTNNSYSHYYGIDNVLDYRPTTTSITENKIAGSIQFSATYKGISEKTRALKNAMGALSVSLNVQDNNYVAGVEDKELNTSYTSMRQIAIIPVIGRKEGPIIQNMGTTKEITRTVTLEAVYGAEYRYPDAPVVGTGLMVSKMFAPSGNLSGPGKPAVVSYLTDLQYQWDWPNGKLSMTTVWTFTP